MTSAPDLLDALREVHAPTALPGPDADLVAAVLAGFVLAVAVAVLARLVLRLRRPVRRAALDALAASRSLADGSERMAAQAALLRRIVRTLDGEAAARERGPAWLARLDRLFRTDEFTHGAGAGFGDALYAPPRAGAADPAVLDARLERHLSGLRR